MALCVDHEGQRESEQNRLKVVPNHALYQAKLRPESSETIITIRQVTVIASNVIIQIRSESLLHYGQRFATPGLKQKLLLTELRSQRSMMRTALL
jgi:hypothetical protein